MAKSDDIQMVNLTRLGQYIKDPNSFIEYRHYLELSKRSDELDSVLRITKDHLKNSRTISRVWFILWFLCACSTAILSFLLWRLT